MAESFGDINKALSELEVGFNRIISNPFEALDLKTYIRLYTLIHDYILYDKTNPKSKANGGSESPYGERIYYWLNDHLKHHLEEVHTEMAKRRDDTLMVFYIEQWKRYIAAAKYNSNIFRYLYRHWVLREMDEGNKNFHSIYLLHIIRWREDIVQNTENVVMNTVRQQRNRIRDSGDLDSPILQEMIESFDSLGIKDRAMESEQEIASDPT